MKEYFREPQVEEAEHSVILQNRCGNRLTLLFHEDRTGLEFVYKPNAYRRKDFRARNFSNRDSFTTLFKSALLPQVRAADVKYFGYDPFVTILHTEAPSRAKNWITVVNVAGENAFAITARCPLLVSFTPHADFAVEDGLIYEEFHDRGEGIVSFVGFGGFEENRYRLLEGGEHALQIMDDEVLIVGGEENAYQARRALSRLRGMSRSDLIEDTEARIAPVLARAAVEFNDRSFQRVIDLNRRVLYSAVDEGGATFGALNRIYHLIWNRDGAMAAAMTAFSGSPEIAAVWAPFILRNPSRTHDREGRRAVEYLQMLGSRWTKHEDDGLYYAALSLFAHYQTTGDDSLLHEIELRPLIDAVEHHVATRLNTEIGVFGSDTRGETTLASSDHFGYDSVDGRMASDGLHEAGEREITYSYSLYHNVNLYNVFRMMEILVAAGPDVDRRLAAGYRSLGDDLERAIRDWFVDPDTGLFFAGHLIFDDGGREWQPFGEDCDTWEYAWAVSVGPFFPCLSTALRSARHVRDEWPRIGKQGYCPWNTLSRMLKEFGMSSAEFKEMLGDEVREALAQTKKYPMKGALTECHGNPEGWRALPFSAGTFLNAVGSLILAGLPAGLAVRASDLVEQVTNYVNRARRIDAYSKGRGDVVASAVVNGVPLEGTLVIPETLLRDGANEVTIARGEWDEATRLYSTSARLFAVEAREDRLVYRMNSPTRADLVFEGLASPKSVKVHDADGRELKAEVSVIEDTGKSLVVLRPKGDFTVTVLL